MYISNTPEQQHSQESMRWPQDAGDDPLLLDDCRVQVGGAEAAVSWRNSHSEYRLLFDDGTQRALDLTSCLSVLSSSRSLVAGGWTAKEDEALQLRRKVGELYRSIAISLGRTTNAVKSRGVQLCHPVQYAPSSGKQGIKTGPKIGWQGVVAEALTHFPNQQATSMQVCDNSTVCNNSELCCASEKSGESEQAEA